jgi:hypothetical protein
VFQALQLCTGVALEDPRLSALHDTLVVKADYSGAEVFMEQAVQGDHIKFVKNITMCAVKLGLYGVTRDPKKYHSIKISK